MKCANIAVFVVLLVVAYANAKPRPADSPLVKFAASIPSIPDIPSIPSIPGIPEIPGITYAQRPSEAPPKATASENQGETPKEEDGLAKSETFYWGWYPYYYGYPYYGYGYPYYYLGR